MKKFSHKLASYLKIKEFEEYQKRVELGKVAAEINRLKEFIVYVDKSIGSSYQIQHNLIENMAKGGEINSLGDLRGGLKGKIEQLRHELFAVQRRYEEKSQEYGILKNELKVLKEKISDDKTAFKKESIKRQENELQDQFIISKKVSSL